MSLRTAKKELDLLESIKTMATDAFNACISADSLSYDQQRSVLKLQLKQIEEQLELNSSLNIKTMNVGLEFIKTVKNKLAHLDELHEIEKQYLSTLPQTVSK